MEVECVDLTGEDVSESSLKNSQDVSHESSSYDVDSVDEAKSSEGQELASSVDEEEVADITGAKSARRRKDPMEYLESRESPTKDLLNEFVSRHRMKQPVSELFSSAQNERELPAD